MFIILYLHWYCYSFLAIYVAREFLFSFGNSLETLLFNGGGNRYERKAYLGKYQKYST